MQSFMRLAVAAVAFSQGALAVPAPAVTTFPGSYECPTGYTTITSTQTYPEVCHYICPVPKSTCRPGQPPHTPFPSTTTTLAPSCTVEVIVEPPICGDCNTCEPLPTA
ncbi:hypothetical protein GGR51DRAFT_561394 [Nemania sp. FL0031]|nr:hypothetical protein GGR51DRAFT_561394 [Nemania sp. FL0031]